MGERISSFKDLRVYKVAFEIQQGILDISKRFPREERYALTDQIRRASWSIGAKISGAWQKRCYVARLSANLLTPTASRLNLSIGWIRRPRAIIYRTTSEKPC